MSHLKAGERNASSFGGGAFVVLGVGSDFEEERLFGPLGVFFEDVHEMQHEGYVRSR